MGDKGRLKVVETNTKKNSPNPKQCSPMIQGGRKILTFPGCMGEQELTISDFDTLEMNCDLSESMLEYALQWVWQKNQGETLKDSVTLIPPFLMRKLREGNGSLSNTRYKSISTVSKKWRILEKE